MAINLALLSLSGLYHSITARRSVKALWTKAIPSELQRATYLWMTAPLSLIVVGAISLVSTHQVSLPVPSGSARAQGPLRPPC
jgi:hypothetical protein